MLQAFSDNVWIAREAVRFLGLRRDYLMTVLRLKNNDLWVHSPLAPDPELCAELAALGKVRYIVASNSFQEKAVKAFAQIFPHAEIFVPSSIGRGPLSAKLDDFANFSALPDWGSEIVAIPLRGMPLINEHMFFHRSSGTLIGGDFLAPCFGPTALWQQLVSVRMGLQKIGQSKLFRACVRDKHDYNFSIKSLGSWPVRRILTSRGVMLRQGCKDFLPRLLVV